MFQGLKRMQDYPEPVINAAKGAIPAGTAVLTVFGYPIADAVQAVMLVWGLCLVIPQLWRGWRWVRRRGWDEA